MSEDWLVKKMESYYAIRYGDDSIFIQRMREVRISDDPMSLYEKLVCSLCERVLLLEEKIK